MIYRIFVKLLLCLFTAGAFAEASDHPLLTRYPGAEIREWLSTDYERVELPVGPADSRGQMPVEKLTGDLTRITYQLDGVSTLKIFENYRSALTDSDATFSSVCELAACGDKDTSLLELAQHVAGDNYVGNHYRQPYFLRAMLSGARGPVYVALFIGGYDGETRIHQVVVEEAPPETGLVSVSRDYLGAKTTAAAHMDQRTEEEKQQDHPMMARYPGARLYKSQRVEYEQMVMPLSVIRADGSAPDHLTLTGDIQRYTYHLEKVSTLKVIENYRHALETLEFSVDYLCELDACGDESASEALAKHLSVSGSVENYFRKPRYMVASRSLPHGRMVVGIYAGSFEGGVWIQQVVVEEQGAEKDLIKVDPDQLYRELNQSGKALVYGIYFDTDSDRLRPESADALQAIATLMNTHPDLSLYVVGHTDDTGDGNYNQDLSHRRAGSVVEILVSQHSVASRRLQPAGVGPYAPVVGNDSEEGRRLNRRVELVRRLQ